MTEVQSSVDAEAPAPPRRRWSRTLRVVTALWVVFFAAHVLLTGHWWLWMFVEPLPPLLLVAVPLLLLVLAAFVRPRPRWTALVLAAVLVAGTLPAGFGGFGSAAAPKPGAPVLRIFSWNTGYWDSGTGYQDFRGDDSTEALYAYLKQQNADVYLLGEHLHWHDGPVRLDDEPTLRARFPGYQVNVEGELVTLSRLPVVGTHPRRDGPAPDDWYWHGNKAQRTDVRAGGCVFSLYNVHLPQPVDTRLSAFSGRFYSFAHGQYDRVETELAALRADLAGNRHPLLVAGDFNSPWMGSLIPLGDGVEARDLTEGALLPASFPVAGTGWGMPRLWRLDWVFTRGEVDLARYAFRSSPRLSDHQAQDLTVSLPCGSAR